MNLDPFTCLMHADDELAQKMLQPRERTLAEMISWIRKCASVPF